MLLLRGGNSPRKCLVQIGKHNLENEWTMCFPESRPFPPVQYLDSKWGSFKATVSHECKVTFTSVVKSHDKIYSLACRDKIYFFLACGTPAFISLSLGAVVSSSHNVKTLRLILILIFLSVSSSNCSYLGIFKLPGWNSSQLQELLHMVRAASGLKPEVRWKRADTTEEHFMFFTVQVIARWWDHWI